MSDFGVNQDMASCRTEVHALLLATALGSHVFLPLVVVENIVREVIVNELFKARSNIVQLPPNMLLPPTASPFGARPPPNTWGRQAFRLRPACWKMQPRSIPAKPFEGSQLDKRRRDFQSALSGACPNSPSCKPVVPDCLDAGFCSTVGA